jgi:hypothetical protein
MVINLYDESIAQAETLMEIEELVMEIIEHFKWPNPQSSTSPEQDQFDESFLNKLALNLMRYLQVFDDRCEYSFPVDVFWQACYLVSLLGTYKLMIEKGCTTMLVELDQMDGLIEMIARLAKSDPYKRKPNDLSYQMRQNNTRLIQYAQALHKRYASLLVVRIDFGYLKESMPLIDIDTFYQHQEKLAKYIDTNPLFAHLAGHARSLEQGRDRGYHSHAVFYFKGYKHRKEYNLIEGIRAIWAEITQEQGTIYSPNLDKKRLKELGILGVGMIHRAESDEVQNSVNAVSYLTKPDKDQHLRIRPKGKRVFFAGLSKK